MIVYVILLKKGHLDDVTHFNLFLFYSFLVEEKKLDFPTIVISHMKIVHSNIRIKVSSFWMLLTKILNILKFL